MSSNKQEITADMFQPAQIDTDKSEEITRESVSFYKDAYRRLLQNKGAVVSVFVIAFIVAMAFIGPHMNDYGFNDQELNRHNLPPRVGWLSGIDWLPFDGENKNGVNIYEQRDIEGNFWFGADKLGRDLWTRIWEGTQVSLYIGVVAGIGDLIIGVAYGGISGFYGGRVDNILQRIYEVLTGIPQLILIILLIMIMQPGLYTIMLVIIATGWLGMSRLIRGQVLQLKSLEYVLSAKTLGASNSRVISKHMVPNTMGLIVVHTMFSIPGAIFVEAFLSFIGLGINAPQASLGSLINEGYQMLTLHPYQALFPGLIISLLLIAFNIFGDGLRDALDPKLRT